MRVSAPLVDLIMGRSSKSFFEVWALQMCTKLEIRSELHKAVILDAGHLYGRLTKDIQDCVDIASEKKSLSWLTVLPNSEHGFELHKGAFHDAIHLLHG